MKTKRTVFEVNDVYRVMENSELIYVLTNSEKLKHEEYKYEQMEMDGLFLSDVLETLTPSRKKVAYAAIELYKRLKEGQVENPAVLSSGNVCKMMHPVLCDITTEEMWVLLLNSSSKLIRKVRISCGEINTAPVDIRVIMKQALYYNAVSFIMVHNHPSGARKPSSADDRLTEAVKKAAETLDIRLLDHVIVAGNISMRTREDCKKGKDGREESRLPEFQLRGSFLAVIPKKEPQKCFSDYRIRYRKIRKDVAFQNKYISSR